MTIRYAVNIADLTRLPPVIATILLSPVRGETVRINKRNFDAVAIELACEEERAAAIVGVLRVRFNRNDLRCYKRGARGGWKRI